MFFTFVFLFGVCVFVSPENALAEIQTGGILNNVLNKYRTAAEAWGGTIQDAATRLFGTLATISMVWTFSQLMFHRSSFAELFGELIRFMMFTGFFLWLLRNGPAMATGIVDSLYSLGVSASSSGSATPSSIVDIGFAVFDMACNASCPLDPVDSAVTMIMSALVLVILSLIAVNMLLQFCSAWVLAYAGVFFLGFGGCKWTSDMAINYFKTVLGIGASIMTMVLLVGVGKNIIDQYHLQMSEDLKIQEVAILLVVAITLFLLVDKLPSMVAGIITGASIGSSGAASFGAGAAVGAAMTAGAMAMGGASKLGSGAVGAAANMAGLAQAVKVASSNLSGGGKSPSATEIGKSLLGGAVKTAGQAVSQAASERVNNSFAGKMAANMKKS